MILQAGVCRDGVLVNPDRRGRLVGKWVGENEVLDDTSRILQTNQGESVNTGFGRVDPPEPGEFALILDILILPREINDPKTHSAKGNLRWTSKLGNRMTFAVVDISAVIEHPR